MLENLFWIIVVPIIIEVIAHCICSWIDHHKKQW